MNWPSLLRSWEFDLEARCSPRTVGTYREGVQSWLRWCAAENAEPELSRIQVRAFIHAQLEKNSKATAQARFYALTRFAVWLDKEGELPNALQGLVPPKLDKPKVPKLSEGELARLFAACSGRSFGAHRDEAFLRLANDTGARASELIGLRVDDVDWDELLITIRRGKGGSTRRVPFTRETAAVVNRYLRDRDKRPGDEVALWLSIRGPITYHGMRAAVMGRARTAGIAKFHLHRLRHTMASRWLADRKSEGGLMQLAGWTSREMMDRYVEDSKAERAIEEARQPRR